MMRSLKQILRQVPGVLPASPFVRLRRERIALRRRTAEEVFTQYWREKKWGRGESVSGSGSDLIQTLAIRNELPNIFQNHAIKTMLDVPCGDFHWMKQVSLDGVDYTGADIVPDLIQRNRQYETSSIPFLPD